MSVTPSGPTGTATADAPLPIAGNTARQIAATAEAAIREGLLAVGDALPTVRSLAAELGVSPATVNSAYRLLRQRGLVVAAGRRGTRVAPRPALRTPQRPLRGPRSAGLAGNVRDLTIGLPDPALLPPLAPALARIDLDRKLRIVSLDAPDPELIELASELFRADGIPADAVTITSGAFDAIERVLHAHLRPGDRVIIEDPAYAAIRDLLLALGLVPVPVPVDESGLLPDSLEERLNAGADALVTVPRAQNPLGAALDSERQIQLRGLLDRHPELLIVEDDHAGIVSGAPCRTLVGGNTRHWAVVRSSSKVLHPDVRLAMLAADETTIARVEGLQALGPRWVSHILQGVVVELMRDPQFSQLAAIARDTYAARRRALLGALAEHGIVAYGRSGLNVWVPVREEAPVVSALLDRSWLVLAGERFRLRTPPAVRITIAELDEADAPEIAEVIASVEQTERPPRGY